MISDPDLIKRLVDEYEVAEAHIKSCERNTLALPDAAVNQLRYAGTHLLEYIKGDAQGAKAEERRDSIEKAINHRKRATFDALETQIFAQLEFISDFQDLCRNKRDVGIVYSDYADDFNALASLQERLQAFKMVRLLSAKDRADLMDISEQVGKFKRKILRLKVKVDQLDSVEVADEDILSVQQFLLSFTATVLGAIVGVVGVLFAVWSWLPEAWWVRSGAIVILLVLFWIACKGFYGWASSRLLTERQRQLLAERLKKSRR